MTYFIQTIDTDNAKQSQTMPANMFRALFENVLELAIQENYVYGKHMQSRNQDKIMYNKWDKSLLNEKLLEALLSHTYRIYRISSLQTSIIMYCPYY